MLYPVIVLLAALLVDKAPFAGDFELYFLKTASFLNYDHKEELAVELAEYLRRPDRRRVMVVFGNSRTLPFNNAAIQERHPDWTLFNFSVPGGTSDYFYYMMLKFQKMGIRPDSIYFAVTPQGFNDASRVEMDESMVNGLPVAFVLREFAHFRLDDLTNYFAKKLFWSYRYRPIPTLITQRMRNNSAEAKGLAEFIQNSERALRRNRGSVPASNEEPRTDPALMRRHAESIWSDFFVPFRYSKNQHYFTERSLAISKEMGIPAALLWARVSPDLRRMKNEIAVGVDQNGAPATVRELWLPEMERLSGQYGATILDMNYGESLSCDTFYDASHMAGICFGELADYLIQKSIQNNLQRGAL